MRSFMKKLLFIIALFYSLTGFGQDRKNIFIVKEDTTWPHQNKYSYVITTAYGDTVLKLDSAKYYICFNHTFSNFAIVGITHKPGWWAIDIHEHLLFQVYNTSYGEPSPDEITNGMIRIVDKKGKIGFANDKGTVVIQPQFEFASSFFHDSAVIGKNCKKILWCCKGVNEDKHYYTKCVKCGVINKSGSLVMQADYPPEQMWEELKWKQE